MILFQGKFVPDTLYGDDVYPAELFTQLPDVHINGAGASVIDLLVPYTAEYVPARKNFFGRRREQVDKFEFLSGEIQVFTLIVYGIRFTIYKKLTVVPPGKMGMVNRGV